MRRRDTGIAALRRPVAPSRAVAVAIAATMAVALPMLLSTAVGAKTGRLVAHLAKGRSAAPALTTVARASDGSPAVGALFTTSRSGAPTGHFCSASVVDSPAGDLVITAAHCMTGRGQVVFVPGYADGRAPYGAWTVTRVIVAPQWTSSADPDDDVAFLVVSQPQTGVAIQWVTGGERLGIGQLPELCTPVQPDPAGVPLRRLHHGDQRRPVARRRRSRHRAWHAHRRDRRLSAGRPDRCGLLRRSARCHRHGSLPGRGQLGVIARITGAPARSGPGRGSRWGHSSGTARLLTG